MANNIRKGWVAVNFGGLSLSVQGDYTPAEEGTPHEFIVTEIEHKDKEILQYAEAFGVLDEITELATIEAELNLN